MYTEKGVEHLRKVEQFLLKEPRRFNMQEGVCLVGYNSGNILEPAPCGTACCIAGASFLITKKWKPSEFVSNIKATAPFASVIGFGYIEDVAIKQIGLDGPESGRLFYTDRWPSYFCAMYNAATTPMERACVGVLRIEHFIKTKFAE